MNLKGRVAKLEAAKLAERSEPSADQLQFAWEMATWLGQQVSTPEEAWARRPVEIPPRSGPVKLTPEMRAWLDGRGIL